MLPASSSHCYCIDLSSGKACTPWNKFSLDNLDNEDIDGPDPWRPIPDCSPFSVPIPSVATKQEEIFEFLRTYYSFLLFPKQKSKVCFVLGLLQCGSMFYLCSMLSFQNKTIYSWTSTCKMIKVIRVCFYFIPLIPTVLMTAKFKLLRLDIVFLFFFFKLWHLQVGNLFWNLLCPNYPASCLSFLWCCHFWMQEMEVNTWLPTVREIVCKAQVKGNVNLPLLSSH